MPLPRFSSYTESSPTDIDARLLHDVQEYLKFSACTVGISEQLERSWQRFYEAYDPAIRRSISRYKLSRMDLDECTQEVWIKLIKTLRNFEYQPSRCKFDSWLFTVVQNQIVDFFRWRKRRPACQLTDLVVTRLEAIDVDVAAKLERTLNQEVLDTFAKRLRSHVSEECYRALHLRLFEGRSVKDVAVILNLSPSQVRLKVSRTKKQLCQRIKRHLNESPSHSN